MPVPLPTSVPSAHLTAKDVLPAIAELVIVKVKVEEGKAFPPVVVKDAGENVPVTPAGNPVTE